MMQGRSADGGLPGPLALTLRLSPARARLLVLGVAALLTVVITLLFRGPLGNVEERVGAEAWKLGADSTLEQRITLIAIDERSLSEIGPWPWPREIMAELSRSLQQAGAQMQLYDVVFPEAREGDAEFIAALEQGNAVLAQVPVTGARQNIQTGTFTHALGGINCNTISGTTHYLGNHAGFAALPKGHISPVVSSDGGVRHIPAVVCVEGSAYPTLGISALLTAAGAGNTENGWQGRLHDGQGWLAPARSLELEAYPGLRIPVDADGHMRISYAVRPESYRAISAADVLAGNFDAAMLDNNWALIGATAFGMGDIVPTPYSGSTPGVELQARILGSLLDAAIPYTPRAALLMQLMMAFGAAVALWLLAGSRQRVAYFGLPIAALVLPLAALALHAWLLNRSGIWLGWLPVALFSAVAASLLLLFEHGRVRLEHNRVYSNLNSYLPEDIARDIAYRNPSSEINAERREVTLLNADLRNFSAYTEARPPEESAALLHCFFTLATDIVERHQGRVHEFRGDGLLAVWTGDRNGVRQALRAARDMQLALQRELLPARPPEGLEPLGLGIGIEQGPVLTGSIGPARRRSHTMLGDTVAIAMRIQEMTAELALPILIGPGAAASLDDEELQSQGRFLLDGLRVPQTLYAPEAPEADRPAASPALKVVPGGRH